MCVNTAEANATGDVCGSCSVDYDTLYSFFLQTYLGTVETDFCSDVQATVSSFMFLPQDEGSHGYKFVNNSNKRRTKSITFLDNQPEKVNLKPYYSPAAATAHSDSQSSDDDRDMKP